MKFPKWYNTENFLGFLLLAGQFNPDFADKHLWSITKTIVLIIFGIFLIYSIINVIKTTIAVLST